jgi:hypothetical protein
MKTMKDWRCSSTIIDLDTRCRWVVSFKPRPIYPRRDSPRYPLDRRLGGPESRSERYGKGREKFFPLPGNEHGFLSRPASNLLATAIPPWAMWLKKKSKLNTEWRSLNFLWNFCSKYISPSFDLVARINAWKSSYKKVKLSLCLTN